MLKVYKKFLLADQRIIIRHYNALKNTVYYYSQRAELKKKHKLCFYNLPHLAWLQYKHDNFLKKRLLINTIIQYQNERNEELQNFVTANKLDSRFSTIKLSFSKELQNIKSQGAISYILYKTQKSFDYIKARFNPEFISKWIVTYVNLYHKSLEAMVEGHREVTRNHETILEDGQTVSEKLKNFENKLSGVQIDYQYLKKTKENHQDLSKK